MFFKMSRVYSIILSLAAAVLAIDQWTKHLALDAFSREGETHSLLSWFNFTLVYNYGAAFGILRNLPETYRVAFFSFLPLAVLALLWWVYIRKFRREETLGPIAMGLVFGGAIGNLVDRLHYGYVIDFIDWYYPSQGKCLPQFHHFSPTTCHWPVFNVADAAITAAMILLIAQAFLEGRRQKKAAR